VPARRARFGFVPGTHDGQGFPLVDVTAGSPAARAGLRPGDVVLEMAGRSFYGLRTPAAEVSAFAAALPPGMPVTMLVQRGMDRFALTVTPERAGVDADRGATAKAAYDEGRRLLAAGSFALAAQAFNTAIANDPGQPVLYVALAETFFRRNDANGELDALQRGASAAPSYRLYTLLGSACRRAGRYDEAIAAFSKAVAVMPPNLRDGGVYEQLGFCYMKKRRYQDALAQFDAAYAVNPRSPAAVYFLGGCHDVLHNRENAIRFYRDYLALRNNNAEWNKYAERRLDALARGAAAPSATGDQLLAFIDEFARSLAAVNANQPPGASPAPAGAPPAAAGATGRPAEPLAVPPGLRGSIEGEWTWADGSTVVIRGDGTCSSSNRLTGTWTLTDPAARRYTVVWSHGYSDVLTLASDGSRLDGKNSRGATIWATRRGR
jgi:tetratricopeptide (TPR) repeat protein